VVSDEAPGDTGEVVAEVVFGFGAGSRIAGYRLEEQVGRGGMAVVFRARDERLGRLVALKILAPALAADDAFRQRFIRESRAAAAVDDPHIVPVFDAGEAAEASGLLFIAMRYVPGGDVRNVMRHEGPLAPARAAAIISQVASALDAAHRAGLVHRDVKPGNMLVDSQPGRPDHVYLADFGLSKGTLSTSVGLTAAGQFLGTVDYISPEQIEGKPVDGRADEYALACAAFEMLTGVPPFRRDEAMAVMYAQLSEPPPLLTSFRPDLPPEADQVLARALAKAPADRYASCRDFADALRVAFGLAAYDSGSGTITAAAHPATQISGPLAGAAIAAADAAPGAGGMPTTAVDFPASPATATSLGHPGPGDGAGIGGGPGDGDGPAPARRRHRLSPLALTGIGALAVAGIAAAALATLPSHGPTSFSKHTSSPTPAAARPTVAPSTAPTATATATVVAPVVATPATVPSVTSKPTPTSSPTPTPTPTSSPTPTPTPSGSPTSTTSASPAPTTGTSGG
jgi:protein kinase-like protein